MRVRCRIAAVAAAGALLALSAAPAQAASPCNPKGSLGYESSAGVRVFALGGSGNPVQRIYMCAFSQNRSRFIGRDRQCEDGPALREFHLAGRFAAYVSRDCAGGVATETVIVRNVLTGKVVHRAPASPGTGRTEFVSGLEVLEVGVVAWIVELYAAGADAGGSVPAENLEVRKIEAGSPKDGELVDSGAGVERYSLAVAKRQGSANRFYWLKGDAAFSDLLQRPSGSVPTAPPPLATSRCTGRGARTLVVGGTRRVFSLPATGDERRIYACQLSQNRRRFLGWQQECQNQTAARDFHFVSNLVAYVEYTCGLVASTDSIVTRAIDTGQVARRFPAATGTPQQGAEPTTTAFGLGVAATGAMVWLGEYDADSAGGIGNVANDDRQVWKFYGGDPAGPTMVDSGDGIDSGSLALGRYQGAYNRFYWMKNGSPFTNTAGF